MRPVSFGMILTYAAIGAAFYLPKYDSTLWDWRDYSAYGVLFALLWWLLRPRRDTLLDGNSHERAGDGFAFLLGKKLRRVLRSGRG